MVLNGSEYSVDFCLQRFVFVGVQVNGELLLFKKKNWTHKLQSTELLYEWGSSSEIFGPPKLLVDCVGKFILRYIATIFSTVNLKGNKNTHKFDTKLSFLEWTRRIVHYPKTITRYFNKNTNDTITNYIIC